MQSIQTKLTLEYLLYELIAPPNELYVNPNGFATWTGEMYSLYGFVAEDFEDGIPARLLRQVMVFGKLYLGCICGEREYLLGI